MNNCFVYILSWNHLVFTKKCLEYVWRYTDPNVPILVIDNGSNEETLVWLRARKEEKKIYLIENGKNIGMAPAHNQAMDYFPDKDFCFLSNDLTAGYNWLEELRKGAYRYKEVGGASPYISPESTYDDFCNMEFRYNYKSNYQYKFKSDPTEDELQNILDEIHNGDFHEFTKMWAETRQDLPPLYEWMTMCLYIKRSTINKVGKFDPQFVPSHWEDMDYMARMNRADLFRISVSPSYMFHFGTITTRGDFRDLDPEIAKEREANEKRFHDKWRIFLPQEEKKFDIEDGDKYPAWEKERRITSFPVSDMKNNRNHGRYDTWEEWDAKHAKKGNKTMNWTFGISTNGIDTEKLKTSQYIQKIIQSIHNQNFGSNDYEIIICTENKDLSINDKNTSVLYIENWKHGHGWITKKKNEIAKHAKFENICLLHDYFILSDNFAESFVEFGSDWDVCTTRVVDSLGVRIMDWATMDHPKWKHSCIPYDVQDEETKKKMYVSGGAFCVKKQFLLDNPLNEKLGIYEAEDFEWAKRLRETWNLKINTGTLISGLKSKPGYDRFSKGIPDRQYS